MTYYIIGSIAGPTPLAQGGCSDWTRETHVVEVAGHAAAVAVLVPVRPLQAVVIAMPRQAAVGAGPVRTRPLQMSEAAAQRAGGWLLHRRTD